MSIKWEKTIKSIRLENYLIKKIAEYNPNNTFSNNLKDILIIFFDKEHELKLKIDLLNDDKKRIEDEIIKYKSMRENEVSKIISSIHETENRLYRIRKELDY